MLTIQNMIIINYYKGKGSNVHEYFKFTIKIIHKNLMIGSVLGRSRA